MATTTSQKYASSDFITKIMDLESKEQNTLNTAAGQVLTETNFNGVFTPIDVNNANTAALNDADKLFIDSYKYNALDIIPFASVAAKNAHLGCKTSPEYANSSNINMTRADNAYHTFNTCSNKAAILNKKYFSVVKPLPAAGVKDPKLFECHVGDDPLLSSTDGPSSNSYYDYVVCWTMGPTVNTFGISADTGDIIINADNIANMGAKQNTYSTTVANYTYGNAGTYLPPNTYVSLKTYIFDLNQVTIAGGFINGGYIGADIPISKFAIVPGTNDTYIVGIKQGPYTKMVKIQLGIGNSKLYPSLPNDGSLYAKAVEAKYTGSYRFVRITASCNNDNWLQISELQVFDKKGNNVAKGKKVSVKDSWPDSRTRPENAVNGNANNKPYPMIHHSGSPCNSWWMVDLGKDVNITRIVYYNRQDCCQGRINGALLDGLGVNGEVLFRTIMNGDMVQTYEVPPNTLDLNAMWNKGISTNLVGNGTTAGYGVKGLSVRVDPVALGKGPSGYVPQQNAQLPASQTSYKTLTRVEPSVCQITCDNDPNCLGYTTSGNSTIKIEGTPTDLGCYKDTWARAMNTANGDGKNKNTCLAEAKKRGHTFFGLQYGGECWTTNDDSTGSGYKKYGPENSKPCYSLGSDWQNRVYKRNIVNKPATNCNFYGSNIAAGSQSATGSSIAVRNQITAPTNNTTLNLTNNALKMDLSQCASGVCKFRLELGTDGNLKLYKVSSSANTAVSSSSTGEVVWDLFSSDNAVAAKIKNIAPIAQFDWKTAFNNGNSNILAAGEALPSTKKQLISSNGQFKLEISGGYLQLKAAVYGCFSADNAYRNTTAPMYTNAVQNGAQSYYVYQSDLSHPKVGNVYYEVSGPNGKAIKNIDRTNPLLLNGSTYKKLPNKYIPSNDINPTIVSATNAQDCTAKCNASTDCKYAYVKNDNQCILGNKLQPAYVPQPSDSIDKYALYLRNQTLDTTNVESTISLNPAVKILPTDKYRSFKPAFFGPQINGPKDIGGLATPIGQAIADRRKILQGSGQTIKPISAPPDATQRNIATTTSNYSQRPPAVDNTSTGSAFVSLFEGFDSHEWSDPGANCGEKSGIPSCYAGIRDGQIKPLQSIAKDYSNKLNEMNKIYRDISGNISEYNKLYDVMNNNYEYDFSGNQPIVLSGNTDLLTEMKNDSKRLALQTNNMYIAGSILTTTLLVSAIYLGRP